MNSSPHADIVIQNFRPKVMERLGIGYEELKKINPRIILASISGFGQEGHMAHKPALDSVAAAEGGLMDLTGFPDGKPVKNTMAMTDYLAGYTCVIAMMAALRYRDATGIGQHLDISMLDCAFSTTEYFAGTYCLTGEVVTRAGNGRAFSAPSNIYQTKDGRWVNIQAPANNLAFRLFELIGRPDLIAHEDMQTPLSRKQHEYLCDEAIGAWAAQYTVEEACAMLDEHGIPNGRVQNITQVMENPLIRERGMLVRMPDGRFSGMCRSRETRLSSARRLRNFTAPRASSAKTIWNVSPNCSA